VADQDSAGASTDPVSLSADPARYGALGQHNTAGTRANEGREDLVELLATERHVGGATVEPKHDRHLS
jgi:hypothetical protein